MSFDRKQLKTLIDKVTKSIELYSEDATALLLGTCAVESRFGTYLYQIGGGPAQGIFQMEPATENDIWVNFLKFKPSIEKNLMCNVLHSLDIVKETAQCLQYNLAYQIAMARIHYYRRPEPLPSKGDIPGMAKYWKKYYNTVKGKGTEEEFTRNYYYFCVID